MGISLQSIASRLELRGLPFDGAKTRGSGGMSGKVKVGILTYDLQPFTAELIARIANGLSEAELTAYPCFAHESQNDHSFKVLASNIKAKPMGVNSGEVREAFTSSINIKSSLDISSQNDIVILYGLQGASALLAATLARLRGKRLISVIHSLAPLMESKRKWWVKLAKKYLLSLCHLHICQMPASRATLSKVYGVSVDKMRDAPFEGGAGAYRNFVKKGSFDKMDLRRQISVPLDAHVFLFAGNIIPLKGLDLAIRAFARTKSDNSVLIVVGQEEPDYGEQGTIDFYKKIALEEGCADRCFFLGRVQRQRLAELYALSDVFVLPTWKDCLPKVFIEAAIFGLPIVTTEAPGSVGLFPSPNESGFVVSVGDVDALSVAMDRIQEDGLIGAFSARIRATVEEFCQAELEKSGFVSAIREVY